MLALEYNTIVVKLGFERLSDTEITDEVCSKFQNETIRLHPFNRATIVIRWVAVFSHSDFVA